MTTVSGAWASDERAVRAANERLPVGYCIVWVRDEHERFCADLHSRGLNLCGLAARGPVEEDGLDHERERVLRVLVEPAWEHVGEGAGW